MTGVSVSCYRVWAWRPVPPSVPPRLLRKKRLQPLGWVFTTTAAPPDVENVAVVSEAFLDPVNSNELGQPEEASATPVVDPGESIHRDGGAGEFFQASVAVSAQETASSSNVDPGSGYKFVVDSTTNFVFLSCAGSKGAEEFYQDHDGVSSPFRCAATNLFLLPLRVCLRVSLTRKLGCAVA